MRDGVGNTIPYAIGARSDWTLQDEHISGDILRRRWSARYGSTLDKAAGPAPSRHVGRLGGVAGHCRSRFRSATLNATMKRKMDRRYDRAHLHPGSTGTA